MHTDETLDIFDSQTVKIGAEFRSFKATICPLYHTRELPKEARKRRRRQVATSKHSALPAGNGDTPSAETLSQLPRERELNINTVKHHFMGDYAWCIRNYGTVDNYTTEAGELEHKCPKSRYTRTDRREYRKQLARIERRIKRIRRIRARLVEAGRSIISEKTANTPQQHHHIAESQNDFQHLGTFLRTSAGDPAIKV
jgi:hypothetical protein